MNKQAVMAVALLAVTGYAWAGEQSTKESVQITLKLRVDRDLFKEVLNEVKEDAKALEEKYAPVCGIDEVRTAITQNAQEEQQVTKSCGCSCKCKSCSSGSCCKCKSVGALNETEFCTCASQVEKCIDCGKPTEEVRCACGKPKQKGEETIDRCGCNKPKQKSVRAIQETEYCNCQIVQEKCPDCGKVTEEFRCACGKPKQKEAEVDRCACSNKPKQNKDTVQ